MGRPLATEVARGDDEVDRAHAALEADCIACFALDQPVATELRLVAATYKISTDLERIGDLTANLGAHVRALPDDRLLEADLVQIAELAHLMLADALEAYTNSDASLAAAVVERDEEIDGLCARAADLLIRELATRRVDGSETAAVVRSAQRLLVLLRDLERIADHAVNVAARTYYALESDDRHLY